MSAGGSSSGSGAATAAFLCATSLGEDTGGSIRRPAAWCGLVGLRPGWGRVSRHGVMPGVWSMDAVGPISRTVEDAAITLGAIAGHDPKDPYTWNTPVPDYRRSLDGNIRGHAHRDSNRTVGERARAGLRLGKPRKKRSPYWRKWGLSVDEVSIPLTDSCQRHFMRCCMAVEPALNQREWVRTSSPRLRTRQPRSGCRPAVSYPGPSLQQSPKTEGSAATIKCIEALDAYDVLVSPTSGRTGCTRSGMTQCLPSLDDAGGRAALHADQHLQSGQRPRHIVALRLQLPEPPDRATNRWPARRGRNGAER